MIQFGLVAVKNAAMRFLVDRKRPRSSIRANKCCLIWIFLENDYTAFLSLVVFRKHLKLPV